MERVAMQCLLNHSEILESISYTTARKTYRAVLCLIVGVLISEEGKH